MKTKNKNEKLVHLGRSILKSNKTLTYEFWYNYIKTKVSIQCKTMLHGYRQIYHYNKTNVYEDIENDVEKRFDTSNYEINRPLQIGKNKKVIGLMIDKLGEKNMTEFVELTPKTYFYLINNGNSNKKVKRTKNMHNKKKT